MRNAPIIGLLVGLLLTAAFWFLLYQPQNERQGELEAEIADLEGQASSLQAQIDSLEAIKADEVQIRAALARAEEYIPSGIAQPSAIRQLQRTADLAGTTLQILTFGNAQAPTGVDAAAIDTGDPTQVLAEIPVTIAVDGGYFQIVDFLRRVEADVPRAMLIQNVLMEESPDGDFPRLRATLTSKLFAIVNADALPIAPGGTPAPTVESTEGATAPPTEAAQ